MMKEQDMMKRNSWRYGAALAGLFALTACGGGGGGNGNGELQVSVTDAPVDNATDVVVKFSSIDVKPRDGAPIRFPLATPRSIDLLEFTDGNALVLLPPVDLPAGDYEWLRLNVIDTSVSDSFVRLNDGSVEPIKVPSDKLRLIRGFTVPEGGLVALTVDFDLRKALVDPVGQDGFFLKPVLRVVEDDEVGRITGTVSNALVTASGCQAALPTATDSAGRAVYVYGGSGTTPDDIGGAGTQPVVSSFVKPATDGSYRYTVAYLPAGNYTVAFTCQAETDNPEADDVVLFSA